MPLVMRVSPQAISTKGSELLSKPSSRKRSHSLPDSGIDLALRQQPQIHGDGCDADPAQHHGDRRQHRHQHLVEEEGAAPQQRQQQQQSPVARAHRRPPTPYQLSRLIKRLLISALEPAGRRAEQACLSESAHFATIN